MKTFVILPSPVTECCDKRMIPAANDATGQLLTRQLCPSRSRRTLVRAGARVGVIMSCLTLLYVTIWLGDNVLYESGSRAHARYFNEPESVRSCTPAADKVNLPIMNNNSVLFINDDTLHSHTQIKFENPRQKANADVLDYLLSKLRMPDTDPVLMEAKCGKCIVVGSGSCLRDRNLGETIDSYDVVIRMNDAPIRGFEKLVGSRTDIRFLYPESAPGHESFYQSQNNRSIVIALVYKPADLVWIARLFDTKFDDVDAKFWKSAVTELPIPPEKIFIANPDTQQVAGYKRLTTGTSAIVLSSKICSSVDVAGFCNDRSLEYAYYHGNIKMIQMIDIGPHDRMSENELRSLLKEKGIINKDLTVP